MRSITAYCWICIFLCGPFLTESFAQKDDASWFRKGDSLFAAQQYRVAAIEYERVIFLNRNKPITTPALLRKAEAYKQMGEYRNAVVCLNRATPVFLQDSIKYQLYHQAALNAYLGKNYLEARAQFKQMRHFVQDSALVYQSEYLEAITLNELFQWEEARDLLKKMIDRKDLTPVVRDSFNLLVDNYYHRKRIPKLKSAKKADTYSTYLPGLGQVYVGAWGEAIKGNLLLGVSGLFFAGSILTENYVTAFTAGSFLVQSFYFGGLRRLEYLVEKRNYDLSRSYNDELRSFILALNKV